MRLQPPCWPVYSICGPVNRLRRQLGWHSGAVPLSPSWYREVRVSVCPLIIRPRFLLPLQDPGSWLHSFVAKSNLRDSFGIAACYRKQGHRKRQTTTWLYTRHNALSGYSNKTQLWFEPNEADLRQNSVQNIRPVTSSLQHAAGGESAEHTRQGVLKKESPLSGHIESACCAELGN